MGQCEKSQRRVIVVMDTKHIHSTLSFRDDPPAPAPQDAC